MRVITGVSIKKIMFVGVGTYERQFNRPLQPRLREEELDAVTDLFEERGSIKARDLARLAPDITMISDIPRENIIVANGFGTERYSFCIVGVVRYDNGSQERFQMSGYTEHDEMIGRRDQYYQHGSRNRNSVISRRIDRNAIFHITAFASYRPQQRSRDEFSGFVYQSGGMLLDPRELDKIDGRGGEVYRLSPEAAISGLDVTDEQMARHGSNYTPVNERILNPMVVTPSAMTAGSSVTTALNLAYSSANASSVGDGDGDESVYTDLLSRYTSKHALGSVLEMDVVKHILDRGDTRNSGGLVEFTWDDLLRYDPDLESDSHRVEIFGEEDSRINDDRPSAGRYDRMDGSSSPVLESVAQAVACEILAIMQTQSIQTLSFICENMNVGREDYFSLRARPTFSYAGASRSQEQATEHYIEDTVLDRVWPIVTRGQMDAEMEISAIDNYVIIIKMHVEGAGEGTWAFPAFVKGLYSPNATSDHMVADTTNESLRAAISAVVDKFDLGGSDYDLDLPENDESDIFSGDRFTRERENSRRDTDRDRDSRRNESRSEPSGLLELDIDF